MMYGDEDGHGRMNTESYVQKRAKGEVQGKVQGTADNVRAALTLP